MEQDSTPGGLCKNGCGFFGNQSFEGMCSKCFKDHVKRKQSSPNGGPSSQENDTSASETQPAKSHTVQTQTQPMDIPMPTTNRAIENTDENLNNSGAASTSFLGSSLDENFSSPGKQKKRNRCFTCKKKVGLTGFDCRCGGVYCGLHRYSNEHNCTFDYKTDGREQLASANPVVVGEKVKKI